MEHLRLDFALAKCANVQLYSYADYIDSNFLSNLTHLFKSLSIVAGITNVTNSLFGIVSIILIFFQKLLFKKLHRQKRIKFLKYRFRSQQIAER